MSDRCERLCSVAGPVSRETFNKLQEFEATFQKWARRINLVAPSTLESVWERHVVDSAQLLPLAPEARAWLDLGSGGGFPGAVLAILLQDRSGALVTLVESNGRKAAFLRNTLAKLEVPAVVHNARIEHSAVKIAVPDVVTARALAPLPTLLGLSSPWLCSGSRGLFHKGRDYRREVEESRVDWKYDLVEHADKVDANGIILEVADLRRRI